MKKTFLFLLVICFNFEFLFSQHITLNNKLSINLNYSSVPSNTVIVSGAEVWAGPKLNSKYQLELGYDVIKNLTVSAYIGYAGIRVNHLVDVDSVNNTFGILATGKNAFFYGLNLKYHFLPLIFDSDKLKFDMYITGNLGIVSAYSKEFVSNTFQTIKDKPFTEYGIGIGAGYFITKRIGLYGEYTIGHYYNSRSMLKGGVIFKF